MKSMNILAGAMLGLLATTLPAIAAPVAATKKSAAEPVEIWFIRHAESEVNVLDEPSGAADEGVSYPLTVKGMAQANQLAAALKDVPVTTIYSSTRLRTVQTADAIAFSKGLALNLAPEIVEIGVGLRHAPGGESAMKETMAVMEQWKRGNDEVRFGSENLRDVRRRFMPFWERLLARHSGDDGVIVVVTHGGIMSFVLPVLCENMPVSFTTRHLIPNTGILKTELKSGQLSCNEWNGITPG